LNKNVEDHMTVPRVYLQEGPKDYEDWYLHYNSN